jgi:hypothetical protein
LPLNPTRASSIGDGGVRPAYSQKALRIRPDEGTPKHRAVRGKNGHTQILPRSLVEIRPVLHLVVKSWDRIPVELNFPKLSHTSSDDLLSDFVSA